MAKHGFPKHTGNGLEQLKLRGGENYTNPDGYIRAQAVKDKNMVLPSNLQKNCCSYWKTILRNKSRCITVLTNRDFVLYPHNTGYSFFPAILHFIISDTY